MDVLEAMQARRSVRKFTDETVSGEQLDALLHAAMSGPSACNRRPWQFYAVTNAGKLEALRGASRFSKMQAPLAIVIAGDLRRALPFGLADYWIQDCSAAAENVLLAATGLGLGAVWCGLTPQAGAADNVRAALSLPEKQVPLALIFIGHPAESPAPRDQYEADRVHFVE